MIDAGAIRRVFEDVLEQPPDRREAFLRRVCADDESRDAVRRLLAADAVNAGLLDQSATSWVLDAAVRDANGEAEAGAARDLSGRTIGRYTLLRRLGQGGMGDVYEARQDEPGRRVALKLLRPSTLGPGAVARFRHEAEVLARLEHPNIARLYDAGTFETDVGVMPWFVMELIEDARTVTAWVRERDPATDDRLRLFATVCDAVHHGHRRGFVHRDLKPGNILVDPAGAPRVIDFGVARAIDIENSLATLHTSTGQMLGSLRYMSPEQCTGRTDAVDARSDVYALGVVLFEMLTGLLPYDVDPTTSVFDIPRIITTTPPRAPSSYDKTLRGDIEAIILRALRKDPDRRYQTASDLAADVRRHLAGETLDTRRDPLHVAARAMRRHRVAVGVAAGLGLLLAGVLFATARLRGRVESLEIQAGEHAELRQRDHYAGTIALARAAFGEDSVAEMNTLLADCPEDLRGWEWWHLAALADDTVAVHDTASLAHARRPNYPTTTPASPGQRRIAFAVSPDGGLAAIGSDDGAMHLWDLGSGTLRRTLAGLDEPVLDVAFSADGRRMAAREWLTAESHAQFAVWDVQSGAILSTGRVHDSKGRCALTPDGRRLVVSTDNQVLVWDVDDGQEVGRCLGHRAAVNGLALSPDGRRLASSSENSEIAVWDLDSRERRFAVVIPRGESRALAFSPDGRLLLVSDATGALRCLDVETGGVVRSFGRLDAAVRDVAWAPDGSHFATRTDMAIEVRDAIGGDMVARLHGPCPLQHTWGLDYLPDGRRLAALGADGRIQVFDLDRRSAAGTFGRHDSFVDAVATSRDGRWAASCGREGDRTIALWDLDAKTRATRWPAHTGGYRMHDLAFSPDGTALASAGEDRMIGVWSVPDGRPLATPGPCGSAALCVSWSPDGSTIFSASRDGFVYVWSYPDGALLETFQPGRPLASDANWTAHREPRIVEAAPVGDLVATSGHEGVVRLWHWPGWSPGWALTGHAGVVRDLAFSPDGDRLASAATDGTVRIWSVADGTCRRVLSGQVGATVKTVAFAPGGRRLLTSAGDPVHRWWDLGTGRLLMVLSGHEETAHAAAVSGDGRHIVAAGLDGAVRFWAAPGYAVDPPR